MFRSILTVVALMTLAVPAVAERQVTADEFAEIVTGKTFYFDRRGEAFGSEQYFDDKRVIWAFEGGGCQRGIWFTNTEGQICFVYDSSPTPQCWDFLETDSGGFNARFDGDEPANDLVTRRIDEEPLSCPLPDLGV